MSPLLLSKGREFDSHPGYQCTMLFLSVCFPYSFSVLDSISPPPPPPHAVTLYPQQENEIKLASVKLSDFFIIAR